MNRDRVRDELLDWLHDARDRSRALVLDLDPALWEVPRDPLLTPFRWEFAHVTWFHERFVLRAGLGQEPRYPSIDALYDSGDVDHPTRWDLEHFEIDKILEWDDLVRARIADGLVHGDAAFFDFVRLGIFHEDMHAEAFAWIRQYLAYPAPDCPSERHEDLDRAGATAHAPDVCLDEDVSIDACRIAVGASRENWGYDNELGGDTVDLEPFEIARRCVSESEYLAFVEDDGYTRDEFWDMEGRAWRDESHADAPATWSKDAGSWRLREFDRHRQPSADLPVMHVCWHEANAWCRWANRRLPTEFEWERVAAGTDQRRFPWGESLASCAHSGFQGPESGTVLCPQSRHESGRCPGGTSHLIGNVWEWTASSFEPHANFQAGVYENYSAPFFGTRRVLRGGSWATMQRMVSATMRNFFEPFRRDIFAGFRTCAIRS